MDSTNRGAEMPARGLPLHQFPPPLPEDHTDILGDPDFHTDMFWDPVFPGHPIESIQRRLGDKIQASDSEKLGIVMPHSNNLFPLGVPPDPKIPAQHQFTNKIPFRANLHRLRVLPDQNMQPQYRLQFINKVQNPTFTTNLVRDDNGSPIKVAIYNMSTQSIISPDTFLSSAKVKITVLNSELVENKGETLSRGEFNQSVLKERERKGPILTGRSRSIQLENGVGTFENIVFNDNSSWTKSGFRLGVMVVSEGEEGCFNGERVQEGVSEPFRVKDRRGKAFQKPDRLKLTHKVQSLKKVGKDRASLLQKKDINTVEDFLKFYYNDEPALRKILGIKSESSKEWDSMVEHATQCADEFHAKNNALNNSSQPQQALVHPMEGNQSLSINGGSSVVGSGSSEPNPSENFEDLYPSWNQFW